MRTWFNGSANDNPVNFYNATIVTMEWVRSFRRANTEYNNLINKKMWSTPNARREIANMLSRKGLLTGKEQEFGDDAWFRQTANVLDPDYVQQLLIGDDWTEKAGMGIREYITWHDDLDAALANFNLRMVVGGKVRPVRYEPTQGAGVQLSGETYTASKGETLAAVAQKKNVTLGEMVAANPGLCNPLGGAGATDVSGLHLKIPKSNFSNSNTANGMIVPCKPIQYEVEILRVGVYVRDSYDFIDEPGDNQELGKWPIGEEISLLGLKSRKRCTVYNRNFRDWRDRNKKGRDYLVFSDVQRTDLKEPYKFVVNISN